MADSIGGDMIPSAFMSPDDVRRQREERVWYAKNKHTATLPNQPKQVWPRAGHDPSWVTIKAHNPSAYTIPAWSPCTIYEAYPPEITENPPAQLFHPNRTFSVGRGGLTNYNNTIYRGLRSTFWHCVPIKPIPPGGTEVAVVKGVVPALLGGGNVANTSMIAVPGVGGWYSPSDIFHSSGATHIQGAYHHGNIATVRMITKNTGGSNGWGMIDLNNQIQPRMWSFGRVNAIVPSVNGTYQNPFYFSPFNSLSFDQSAIDDPLWCSKGSNGFPVINCPAIGYFNLSGLVQWPALLSSYTNPALPGIYVFPAQQLTLTIGGTVVLIRQEERTRLYSRDFDDWTQSQNPYYRAYSTFGFRAPFDLMSSPNTFPQHFGLQITWQTRSQGNSYSQVDISYSSPVMHPTVILDCEAVITECRPNYNFASNGTTPPTPPPPPTEGGECPVGYHDDGMGGCTPDDPAPPPPPTCPTGYHDDGTGNCIPDNCPPGYYWDGTACVPLDF